jgi:hypothetical protein
LLIRLMQRLKLQAHSMQAYVTTSHS